jgi:hypothetical protein
MAMNMSNGKFKNLLRVFITKNPAAKPTQTRNVTSPKMKGRHSVHAHE